MLCRTESGDQSVKCEEKEIRRGCVLAPKNSMKNTDLLDVKLKVLEDSMRILTNHERLHLYTGTSEILCRAVLLDKEQIGPGEEGLVQLRLEEEIAVKRGDRFVVRFYSPMETIGGGIVLNRIRCVRNVLMHRQSKN